jgi:hypothetical protein
MQRSHSRSSYPADKMLPAPVYEIHFDPDTGKPGPRRKIRIAYDACDRRMHNVKTRQRNRKLCDEGLQEYESE